MIVSLGEVESALSWSFTNLYIVSAANLRHKCPLLQFWKWNQTASFLAVLWVELAVGQPRRIFYQTENQRYIEKQRLLISARDAPVSFFLASLIWAKKCRCANLINLSWHRFGVGTTQDRAPLVAVSCTSNSGGSLTKLHILKEGSFDLKWLQKRRETLVIWELFYDWSFPQLSAWISEHAVLIFPTTIQKFDLFFFPFAAFKPSLHFWTKRLI